MFIFSWNIDALRPEKWEKLKGYIALNCPEVVCLNETKGKAERLEKMLIELSDYDYLINSHKPAQMHGVVILIRKDVKWEGPIHIPMTCPSRSETKDPNPACGRLLAIKLLEPPGELSSQTIILVAAYIPNSGVDWRNPLKNLDYRTKVWDPSMFQALRSLEASHKHVIWIGDINVAPEPIDVSHPNHLLKHAGFTPEERDSFKPFIAESGWVDIWRQQHPQTVAYSFKGYNKAKYKLRLDNCIVTPSLVPFISESTIFPDKDFMESDHNPIAIRIMSACQTDKLHNPIARRLGVKVLEKKLIETPLKKIIIIRKNS